MARLREPWVRWLERAIEPREAVVGAERRRRARYTALSILILVPIGVVALLITAFSHRIQPQPPASSEALITSAVLLVLVALYPVSVGPRFVVASYSAIAITASAIWVLWLLDLTERGGGMSFYLALPIVMASLLVGSTGAGAVAAVNIVGTTLVSGWLARSSDVDLGQVLTAPLFLVLVSGFVVNSARIREKDLGTLEALAAKLREQEAMRIQMLNNVAHDLSSPLTPIKLQLAMIPKDKPIPPERLEVVKRNLAQVERLVADLKDLARLEAGGFRLDPKPVDLCTLARTAADAFRGDAEARGLRLDVSMDGELPVQVDPERVTQVIYNLVTNALKFTPAGGSVAIHAHASGDEAEVSVRDSGRGLTPDEMARLFKPFSQVHDRAEVKERGTGLGLFISRGIATAHGGALSVVSEGRGRGSTFTLRVPLRPREK